MKDATDTLAKVLLHTNSRTVNISTAHLKIAGDNSVFGNIPTNTYGSGLQTPMYSGSQTPMHGAATPRAASTPSHDGGTEGRAFRAQVVSIQFLHPFFFFFFFSSVYLGSQTPSYDGARTPNYMGDGSAWDANVPNTPHADTPGNWDDAPEDGPPTSYDPGSSINSPYTVRGEVGGGGSLLWWFCASDSVL